MAKRVSCTPALSVDQEAMPIRSVIESWIRKEFIHGHVISQQK
jgi:hypothetical protein